MSNHPYPDFTYRDEGTVLLFIIQNAITKQWVKDNLDLAGWQWLGPYSFAVDYRAGYQLIEQLRGPEGFNVMEVR